MNAVALLEDLRGQGIALTARGAGLTVDGPADLLNAATVDLLRDRKPEILEALAAERAEAVQLAEAAGVCMLFLQVHAEEWSDAEWIRRRDLLCRSIDTAHAALQAVGMTWEQAGWGCTAEGDWSRIEGANRDSSDTDGAGGA